MPAIPDTAVALHVRKTDLRDARIATSPLPTAASLAPGQVLLAIDRFALTANNITYAAYGDRMQYWQFFPAPEGFGIIPVWGFANVVASSAEGITAGERFYGYYPLASHLVVDATRVSPAGFVDGAVHRQPLPAVYNAYSRVSADPGYDAAQESEQALLRPLFYLSFLAADFLADNAFFGADAVILSSASSKTAYGLAHELSRMPAPRPRVVGLTSKSNRAFVAGLGCYDEVLTYDEVDALSTGRRSVYVDMSGSKDLRSAIHSQLGAALTDSCAIGGTDWEHLGGSAELPGPKPVFFFAPAQIKKRSADWGAGEVQKRFGIAWQSFAPNLARWMRVVESHGPDAVAATYRLVLDGKAGPDEGHILWF